jgi:membrane-associated protease RseP (regulator of RpoE activity)
VDTVLLFILGVVVFIVGLVVSVALHELGHLTFAKLFGVRVSQYMVGFGRTLWSKTIRGTEYGVKPILLGGYISMAGMFPPGSAGSAEAKPQGALFSALVQDARASSAESIGSDDHSGAFYMAKPWKRIIIMFAGPFMNLVIGVVIAAVLITGFGTPASTIGAVESCVPASPTATTASKCTDSDPVSPASTSGLKKGDLVVSLNGVSYPSPTITQSLLQHSAGKAVTLVVKRAGKLKTISVTPVTVSRDAIDSSGLPVTDSSGKPVVQKLGAVGVALGQKLVPQPITATFGAVGSEVNGIFTVLGRFPAGIVGVWNSVFGGAARSPNSPVSVVGVGRAIGDIASTSDAPVKLRIYDILSLLGELNISLFVFNLIPLLPLDGGHIIGAVWEATRRFFAKLFRRRDPGPVDLAKLMPLTVAVVTVLIAVSALLIVADLVNPVSVG